MTSDLLSLEEHELVRVYDHEVQERTLGVVVGLLEELRECDAPATYYDFQRRLFQHLWQVESARQKVRQNLKRIRRGLAPAHDAPPLADDLDPLALASWALEDLVHVRAARQLRSVGDALAWRVSGFDRRYVMALAHNEAAGPITAKIGLDYELGAVEQIWNERGRFALLHDLTSCLRIADLTEFHDDGRRSLHEVKRTGKHTSSQGRRMTAAVAAVNRGAPLPGSDVQLVEVEVPYKTHLAVVADLLHLAETQGVAAAKIAGGRALVVSDLVTVRMSGTNDLATWVPVLERKRATVMRRTGIGPNHHTIVMRSSEAAGRSPIAAPYGVYPIDPLHAATLICDRATFEVTLSAELLATDATTAGFDAEVLLPDSHGDLDSGDRFIRIRLGDSVMDLYPGSLQNLLSELVDLDIFWGAMRELLTRPIVPLRPTAIYENEAAVWR